MTLTNNEKALLSQLLKTIQDNENEQKNGKLNSTFSVQYKQVDKRILASIAAKLK